MRKRFFTLTVVLAAIVSGAWAQLTYVDLSDVPYGYWTSFDANPVWDHDASSILTNNIGETVGAGGTVWGRSGAEKEYFTVLDDCQVMLIKKSASTDSYVRLFFNRQPDGLLKEVLTIETDEYATLLDDGVTWSIDLAKFKEDNGFAHLNAIKVPYSGPTKIEEIKLGKPSGLLIDAEQFPDENFRAYINDRFDKNHDGYLSNEDIANAKQIILDDGEIQDFTGISIFTALRDFSLVNHKVAISPLDLSANTNLQIVWITGDDTSHGVGSININGCTELEQLHLRTNHLTELDLSTNSKLTKIYCDNNQLTTLDLSGCPEVKQVYCFQNQITGEGMENLVANLPTRVNGDGVLSVVNSNAETEGNSMTTLQVATAKEKGWRTFDWAGGQYEGVDTGIDAVIGDNNSVSAPYYDLSGRRLNAQPAQKGIYIQGGKAKVIK